MPDRSFLPPLALLLATSGCGLLDSDEPELTGCLPGYAEVEQVAAPEIANRTLQGAAVLIRVDGRTVCRLFFGSYAPATQVFTASAAKWLTAAALLAVVDRGKLRLDSRTIESFPQTPPTTAGITLTQLLSHTSGLLWFSRCMGRPDRTLQECAEEILDGDSHFAPGEGFFYAGPPFTVAGAMAERALGKSWAQVFQSTIAGPLGMTSTSFGEGPNPALSEGEVASTLDDYGRFVQMILDNGQGKNGRVLSAEAILAMRRNRSGGVPVVSSPRGEIPYGLGCWLDAVDAAGLGTVLSSPGAGGFVPMVDYGRRMVFVFEAFDDIGRVWPAVTAILDRAREVADREHAGQ